MRAATQCIKYVCEWPYTEHSDSVCDMCIRNVAICTVYAHYWHLMKFTDLVCSHQFWCCQFLCICVMTIGSQLFCCCSGCFVVLCFRWLLLAQIQYIEWRTETVKHFYCVLAARLVRNISDRSIQSIQRHTDCSRRKICRCSGAKPVDISWRLKPFWMLRPITVWLKTFFIWVHTYSCLVLALEPVE